MITVLFFGRLKEQLQCSRLQINVSDITSVHDLKSQILQTHPNWQDYFSDHQVLVAVDKVIAKDTSIVHVNAEVAFFPPVTGG